MIPVVEQTTDRVLICGNEAAEVRRICALLATTGTQVLTTTDSLPGGEPIDVVVLLTGGSEVSPADRALQSLDTLETAISPDTAEEATSLPPEASADTPQQLLPPEAPVAAADLAQRVEALFERLPLAWHTQLLVIGPVPADLPLAVDVALPASFEPRELQTACRLLSRLAQQARQLNDRVETHLALERQSMTDPLTGLPNRRAWDRELAARLARPRDGRQVLCVALADADHFKQVNDGFGLAAGDQVLVALSSALRGSLRHEDFVARLGGDEFGLLLGPLDAAEAHLVVERVRQGLPVRMARQANQVVSVSIGYCLVLESPTPSVEQIVAVADRARRLAKQQGRDRAIGLTAGQGLSPE